MEFIQRIIEIKKRIKERKEKKDIESVKYWKQILFRLEMKTISNN